jgi:hypothetical protein
VLVVGCVALLGCLVVVGLVVLLIRYLMVG